jgi:hypothetical protein
MYWLQYGALELFDLFTQAYHKLTFYLDDALTLMP